MVREMFVLRMQLSLKNLLLVPLAPSGVVAERVTATQIRVYWPFINDTVEYLSYTVKCNAVNGSVYEGQELVQEFNTTSNNITIENLHPTLSYSVAVAANAMSGRGNFSEEITVGCKFQLITSVIRK